MTGPFATPATRSETLPQSGIFGPGTAAVDLLAIARHPLAENTGQIQLTYTPHWRISTDCSTSAETSLPGINLLMMPTLRANFARVSSSSTTGSIGSVRSFLSIISWALASAISASAAARFTDDNRFQEEAACGARSLEIDSKMDFSQVRRKKWPAGNMRNVNRPVV